MSNSFSNIPVSPIKSLGNHSIRDNATFGTNFSILQTGGYMEVYKLSDLDYIIPNGYQGLVEYSGNTIPVQLQIGTGQVFSPNVLTLNSDNISSGRRKLGMLVYVYENKTMYQYTIDDYDTLWGNATGATGPGGPTVVISTFGTTVKNNTPEGISFISAWTSSTISGINGYDNTNASWRVLQFGNGVTSVTGDGVNNVDPANPVISQNNLIYVETVTLGDLGLSGFGDDSIMLLAYQNYLNLLSYDIDYETLFELNVIEGPGTAYTYSFISVWRTTTSNETVTLPYSSSGSYDGYIDWGDGTQSLNSYSNQTHTYVNPGDYTITITGQVNEFNFDAYGGNQNKIIEILQWGDIVLGDLGGYFYDCTLLNISNATDTLDVSSITNFREMFYNCNSLTSIPFINTWNVSNGTDMSGMFYNTLFNQDISSWSVSNVTDMSYMFTSSPFNKQLNSWSVSNVTNMSHMFANCNNFNRPLSNWNVLNVTDMDSMFFGSPFNKDISSWNVSGVTNMRFMFALTPFNQPLNSWNVSMVNNMQQMFNGATVFNQPLNNWNVSTVTNMELMFYGATSFNQQLGSWNISSVTSIFNFMATKTQATFSTNNLDDIYNGWPYQNPVSGLNISFGTAKYTSSSSANRSILTGTYGWTIIDGGIL